MKNTKKTPKALINRILEINELMQVAENHDLMVYSYFGSTYPFLINTDCPIEIKNQFIHVTVDGKKERYNTNDICSLQDLKYELTQIKRALKTETKYI